MGEIVGYCDDGTPLYEDYLIPEDLKPVSPEPSSSAPAWAEITARWEYVAADLMQFYGLADWQATDSPWPWFHSLVMRLLDIPESRLARLFPPPS